MKTIIFAGGNGTRLWPVSRTSMPKQFQKLINHKTLFELTVERMRKVYSMDDIYIVIPQVYVSVVKEILPDLADDHIIIEPCQWDTLACIGYAASRMYELYPEETLFLAWSDHIIHDEKKFLDIIQDGDAYAKKENKVIRFGAKAVYPNTNWGYLKFGGQIAEGERTVKFYAYERHYEKPSLEMAKRYVSSFTYLWNMGCMIWPAKKLMDAYKEYSPDTYAILQKIGNSNFKGDLAKEYMKINKISMDFEILEQAGKTDFVVVTADVGWNDVGDWLSLKAELQNEPEDIVSLGEKSTLHAVDADTAITFTDQKGKTICLLGVRDIAVIDTADVLLVCSLEKAADVKKLVQQIKEKSPKLL